MIILDFDVDRKKQRKILWIQIFASMARNRLVNKVVSSRGFLHIVFWFFIYERLIFFFSNQSYGEKWQTRRRMITPAFHFEILGDFLHVMNEQAEIFIEILSNECKTKKEIDVFKKIALCSLDIICGNFFCSLISWNKFLFIDDDFFFMNLKKLLWVNMWTLKLTITLITSKLFQCKKFSI